jgi:hypothetical protein
MVRYPAYREDVIAASLARPRTRSCYEMNSLGDFLFWSIENDSLNARTLAG